MVEHESGFSPFSMGRSNFISLEVLADRSSSGRHNCIGKNLSIMQLRSLIAVLSMKYDAGFAPGEDGLAVCRDMKDRFNQHPGNWTYASPHECIV
jgi:cytochrome P450